MCHASAPQVLWPQAVRYAVHQLNLWPSDARPRVPPVSLWTGSLGVAADYRVWGSLAHVRAPGANNLSPRTRACVFLGFPLDTSGWQFYDPVTCQFFSSQDVTFDESVSYYRSRSHRSYEAFSPPLFLTLEPPPVAPVAPPPSRPAPSSVSHVTPHSSPPQRPVPVVSEGAGGAVAKEEATPEEDMAVSTQRPLPASPPGFPSVPQFPPRSPPRPVAAEPGGVPARETGVPGGVVGGGSGSWGAGAGDTSTGTPTPRTVCFLTRVQRLYRLEREERERFERARQQQQQQSQSEHQERVEEESVPHQVEQESRLPLRVQLQPQQESRARVPPAAVGAIAAAEGESRSGVPTAAAGVAAATVGESRGGATGAAAGAGVAAAVARGGRAAATERPARLSTYMLCSWSPTIPSCCPCRDPFLVPVDSLLSPQSCCVLIASPPPESSLTMFHDPLSDYLHISRPVVSRVLSAFITHPTTPPLSVLALVTTISAFASSHCLNYAAHLLSGLARSSSSGGAPVFPLEVLEDRQFELGFIAATVPNLYAMLLSPEGDPDALDIPIPNP
ncbi:unnamed protein product [Closterium sp. NIES-53]